MFKQPNRTIFIPVCCFAFWFSVCMSLGRLYTFVLSTGAYVFNCQPAPLRTRTFEEHEFWMKNQEPVASMLDAAFEAWRRRWASGSHPQRSKVKIGKIWQNSQVGHLFEMLSGLIWVDSRGCQAPNIGYTSRSYQVASSLMKPPSYTVITPLEANHPNHVISHTHTKV